MRILVTGEPGCGKTAFCRRMIDSARLDGRNVGGVLAPSVHVDGSRVGANVVDLATDESVPFARVSGRNGLRGSRRRRCAILRPGLDLARAAVERAVRQRFDLIVIDEFGPLELAGGGILQEAVDAWNSGRDVILVARSTIADDAVRALGRPPDVRVVPETPPVLHGSAIECVAPAAALVGNHPRPALLALSRV